MKTLSRVAVALVAAALLTTGAALAFVRLQGGSAGALPAGEASAGDRVTRDEHGIPTLTATSWPELIRLQGYVVASERLFQMDLMRRSGSGRLSEWFGAVALESDRRRRLEDWAGVAERAAASASGEELEYLTRYAEGVNAFIAEHGGRAGLEYHLLRAEPEPWTIADSYLVLLAMAEELSSSADLEAIESRWRSGLSPAWAAYLFSEDHPWNVPMFGERGFGPDLPVAGAWAIEPLSEAERTLASKPEETAALDPTHARARGVGSNNWAWCGARGCLLANDPHLGDSVPALWFAVRMRVADDDWAVGVSLPGLPGIILGMNPSLAWAFTNVGEDVDDYLRETLSEDGQSYLAARGADGRDEWRPVEVRRSVIHVRDQPDVTIEGRHTHRGPLSRHAVLGDSEYSRQWLPLVPGRLRLSVAAPRARSWEAMNRALDTMTVPAQNVLVADRAGNIGYRASGTGVGRRVSGRVPEPAIEGEWTGFDPPESRRRILMPRAAGTSTGAAHRFLATANERIWVDQFGHPFADDARKERIRRALSGPGELTREDMERLQRDTESRFHQVLLGWVREHGRPGTPEEEAMVARWAKWDGVAADDPRTFTEAVAVETALNRILLGRVRRHVQDAPVDLPSIPRSLRGPWIAALTRERGIEVFGLDEAEVASLLIARGLEAARSPLYPEQNRWRAQHPFSGLPVVGALFAVDEPPQLGYPGLVRTEAPEFGASTRMVFDLGDPMNSTWIFPVGQSGHAGTPHYSDLQADWFAGKTHRVFDPSYTWTFAPAGD